MGLGKQGHNTGTDGIHQGSSITAAVDTRVPSNTAIALAGIRTEPIVVIGSAITRAGSYRYVTAVSGVRARYAASMHG
eukprot:COSAG05_NODE_739_length_7625_cov_31.047429_2_plen_78_part_00